MSIIDRLFKLLNDLYEVTIILESGQTIVYHLREIKKISNTNLRGIDVDGYKVQYNTVKPFDYKIKKLY